MLSAQISDQTASLSSKECPEGISEEFIWFQKQVGVALCFRSSVSRAGGLGVGWWGGCGGALCGVKRGIIERETRQDSEGKQEGQQ